MKTEEDKNMKCKKCDYSWNTGSKLILLSCPSCGDKNRNTSVDFPDDKEEEGEE